MPHTLSRIISLTYRIYYHFYIESENVVSLSANRDYVQFKCSATKGRFHLGRSEKIKLLQLSGKRLTPE